MAATDPRKRVEKGGRQQMDQSKTVPLVFIVCVVLSFSAAAGMRRVFSTQADGEYWEALGKRDAVGAEVAEMRAQEAEALEGKLSAAMGQMVASKGRMGIEMIKPEGDMNGAPMTGWMHHPDFDERLEMANAAKERAKEKEAAEAAAAAATEAAEGE